jgi:uncharacterized protein YdhG (YjbR/CyaY superfamily)
MAKDDVIEIDGKVVEALPNATFRVNWIMVMWYFVISPER